MSLFWKPYKRGTLMLVSFLADGKTMGGLHVVNDSRKFHPFGVVLATNETPTVEPGDTVLFDEGFVEYVTTAEGEQFGVCTESNIRDIVDLELEYVV